MDALEENPGDIEVARVQAGNKGLEGRDALQLIIGIFNQSDLVVDVIAQLAALFDADHAAVLLLQRLSDVVKHLLCFAGTTQSDIKLDHRKSPPLYEIRDLRFEIRCGQ